MNFSNPEDEWSDYGVEINRRIESVDLYFDFSDIVAENPEKEIDEPTQINVYITPKTSLREIHEGIRSRFVYEKTKIEGLKLELKSLEEVKHSTKKSKYESKKNRLISQIAEFDFENKWGQYKDKSRKVLQKYIPLMPCEVKGTISSKSFDSKKLEECLDVIMEYINLSNSICSIEINSYYQQTSDNICPICEDIMEDSESGKMCKCGYIDDSFTYFPEDDAINDKTGEKQTNTSPKPQLDWLKKFLGEGDYSHFNEELFARLDRLCELHNLPTSDDIKNNKEEGTTDLLIRIAKLGKIDYSHRNAFASFYWGWELPKLTDRQKEEFKRNCINSRKEYPSVSKRRQNLNLDISGFLLLGVQGLVFPRKFFKFPSNNEIIRDANEVWVKICEKLNYQTYILIE